MTKARTQMKAKAKQLEIRCPKPRRSYAKGIDFVLRKQQLRDILAHGGKRPRARKKKNRRRVKKIVQTKLF